MEVYYTKLRTSDWGITVKGNKPESGDHVVVTRRDGSTSVVVVERVIWSAHSSNTHICSITESSDAASAKPVQAQDVSAPDFRKLARAVPRVPLVIPDRTLVNMNSSKGVLSEFSLGQVQDRLQRLHDLQQPEDIIRTLSGLFVSFESGRMEANWTSPGAPEHPYLVTRTGAGQIAREVLPSRFFSGLRKLACLDAGGAQLATEVWNKFGSRALKPRLVRTHRTRTEEGNAVWAIRSCHSSSYGPYDNLRLVEDIRAHAGEFSSLPVISCHVSDTGMRIRFCALDETLAAFAHLANDALMYEPIPMIEVWNSEVGRRRVGMRAGIYRTVSATGLTCWSDKKEFGWIHRGKATRISKGVKEAFRDLTKTAAEVLRVYKRAMEIEIDDAEAYLLAVLTKRRASDTLLHHAREALRDPTVSSTVTLAGVVDAIALAAQHLPDIYSQEEVEREASQVMIAGYRKAEATNSNVLRAEEV